ncbi:hypothetical protein BASA81_003326 [Batrachochytrium salamandrivorans]|nr:hypothetical protein BASA81_003326 [Batrachochytrium salamandrivorans]
MAGSGKSTFTQRVIAEAEEREYDLKSINLDPAVGGGKSEVKAGEEEEEEEEEEGFEEWCHGIPYQPNVDIRDSVDYKQLMKTNELGPNGAIMLSLNMYSTRLNDLSQVVERWKDTNHVDYVCVDTPGQIEVFTWSASGTLFTEMFSRIMPTVLVFVVDTPSMQSASTFVSVLFHACGVMLRTQLPMVLVFNKTDLHSADEQLVWMDDLDALQTALDDESEDTQYMASLSASVSLMMHEFLDAIHMCQVSSVTGEGMDDFFAKVQLAVTEFQEVREEEDKLAGEKAGKERAVEEEEEVLAHPFPAPTTAEPQVSLQKTKQLNADEFVKRKFADFDSEAFSAKRSPAVATVATAMWACDACHVEGNTGTFCRECYRGAPQLPTWFCSDCHLENAGKECKACLASAPLIGSTGAGGGGGRGLDSTTPAPSSSRRSSQVTKQPNWTCFQCTVFNTHGLGVCQVCQGSVLASNKLRDSNLNMVWQCLECGLQNHVDSPDCPGCGHAQIKVEVEQPKTKEEEDGQEFQDGEIVEDLIWSAEEQRFFPLNATRDGKFVSTQPPSPEGDEVQYEYDDEATAGEEEEEE